MERFTQKLGPLPVWAWALIGLAVIFGYWYLKKAGPFASGSKAAGGISPTGPSGPSGAAGSSPDLSGLLTTLGSLQDQVKALAARGPGNGVGAPVTPGNAAGIPLSYAPNPHTNAGIQFLPVGTTTYNGKPITGMSNGYPYIDLGAA